MEEKETGTNNSSFDNHSNGFSMCFARTDESSFDSLHKLSFTYAAETTSSWFPICRHSKYHENIKCYVTDLLECSCQTEL